MQRNTATHRSRLATAAPARWDDIDVVLLDMDGTLLDLNYDNRVWNELVPMAYADRRGIDIQDAKQILLAHMSEIRGTIEFYSFEYWTAFTGIDLIHVHRQATELMHYRPGALQFLRWLRTTGRQTIIATNAHPDSVQVKDEFTSICAEVDAVASSHDYGAPKENQAYWQALQRQFGYTPQRALFVDDNEPVLDAAAASDIGQLFVIATPDSNRPARSHLNYPSFDHFGELCPHIDV